MSDAALRVLIDNTRNERDRAMAKNRKLEAALTRILVEWDREYNKPRLYARKDRLLEAIEAGQATLNEVTIK